MDQNLFRKILQETFDQSRLRNPAYSVRAFSKRLKINHSALSEILNGKRNVGHKLGLRMAESLMLTPEMRRELFKSGDKGEGATVPKKLTQVEADSYRVISDWYHFAILSLVETKSFESEPAWIAGRLSLSTKVVREALARLLRLKLLKKTSRGYVLTGEGFAAPDGIVDSGVRRTHQQYLELAQRSLELDDLSRRDFSAVTMAIDPDKLSEARKKIRTFRDQLCSFLESGQKKEIYQMCFQLFPLSKEV